MNKIVIGAIVLVIALEILNVPEGKLIQIALICFYLVLLGIGWIFGNKPKKNHLFDLIGLIFFPALAIAITSDIIMGSRNISVENSLFLLLKLIGEPLDLFVARSFRSISH